MKKSLFTLAALLVCLAAGAQSIGQAELKEIKDSFVKDPATKAIQNALTADRNIKAFTYNHEKAGKIDHYFKYRCDVRGITNQLSSGRCWMFTSMNELRPGVMKKYDLRDFDFSHNYNFFWDQFEKANLFLENVIATADRPITDRDVEFYFKSPVADGGWHLREMIAGGAKKNAVQAKKIGIMKDVYRVLALCLGEPPTEFCWRYKDSKGNTKTLEMTPQEFYKSIIPADYNPRVLQGL